MLDGNGTLKLGDFGLSKLEGETLEEIFQETVEGSYKPNNAVTSPKSNKILFGDVNYLAPEIINGEEHSKSSDLWSLGCILYEMYTGTCICTLVEFTYFNLILYNMYYRPHSFYFRFFGSNS